MCSTEICIHKKDLIFLVIPKLIRDCIIRIDAIKELSFLIDYEFEPSDAYYPLAWEALCKAYNQTCIIVNEHLDKLLTLPIVTEAKPDLLAGLMYTVRHKIALLKALEPNIFEQVVIRILERSLPNSVRSRWVDRLSSDKVPKLDDLFEFIQNTIFKLRQLNDQSKNGRANRKRAGDNNPIVPSKSQKTSTRTFVTTSNIPSQACIKCNQSHRLFTCPEFNDLKMKAKWDLVKTHKLCRNCLYVHPFPCSSTKRCKKCQKDYHTILHSDKNSKDTKFSTQGYSLMARALLDSCSNANLMTSSLASRLQLQTTPRVVNIGAVNNVSTVSNKFVKATFCSNYNNTDNVPNETFPRENFDIPKNRKLADPQFHIPKSIDVLLASESEDIDAYFCHYIPSQACIKCNQSHRLFTCPEFNDLKMKEKWDLVKTHKLCRNCLYVHPFPCSSTKRCKKCQKDHHTILHSDKKSKDTKFTNPCVVNIGAVDNVSTVSKKFVKAIFCSNYNNTDNVPNETFPRENFDIPKNIKLADPQFHIPKSIDALLASVGGSIPNGTTCKISCNAVKLDQLLERFMAVEDLDYQPVSVPDDVACEEHYFEHTTRDSSGRYTVRLPFRKGATLSSLAIGQIKLGDPQSQLMLQKTLFGWVTAGGSIPDGATCKICCNAVKLDQLLERFMAVDDLDYQPVRVPDDVACEEHYVEHTTRDSSGRRFESNPTLKVEYEKDINDYLKLGHTTLCENDDGNRYYLPHHPIIKETSETIKYRKFQKIFWYHEGKIRVFTLNTVTFGVRCAPFLAIRTLHQLAMHEEEHFLRSENLLRREFYVDDFLSGADTLEDILAIQDEMIQLLSHEGFVIRKWSCNHPSALENIDLDCGIQSSTLKINRGVVWDSQRDIFSYSVDPEEPESTTTKRKLLSQIAKIFDPLGLLGPLTLYAKTLVEECWKANITWDESLP
ncbi:hypothetical protein TSAR_015131 [Trichomalopsis sarcophagae]|uniref:Peptidase aspartic putative domain-containing protein n=1 Tax=Trichomalopsis sarcophagae TaxID=543379 RepID=A0A232EH43_9HYME|nr:hypothetical protein TSAR_015131 [Trichomalopsis sarcophagae]